MHETDPSSEHHQIILKTLELLESIPWETLNLMTLAKTMNLRPLVLYKHFATKGDLLTGIVRYMDEKTLEAYGKGDSAASPQEALFDIIMCRLEALESHKEAIRSLTYGLWQTPFNALEAYPAFLISLKWMLALSHIDSRGILGVIKLKAFAIVYVVIIKTWLEDKRGDLSITMITVDRLLKQIEPVLTGL